MPLIALALLGAAVWLGTAKAPAPRPPAAGPAATTAAAVDPLPSWADGPRKRAILDFVAAVTREGEAATALWAPTGQERSSSSATANSTFLATRTLASPIRRNVCVTAPSTVPCALRVY